METFLVKKGLYCRPVTCDFCKNFQNRFLKQNFQVTASVNKFKVYLFMLKYLQTQFAL